ncbi:MAG: PDZ domain-containing protein [Rhodothermales bacterium]
MLSLLLALLATTTMNSSEPPSIVYDVSWDNASDHYYSVSVDVGDLTRETVEVAMPAWRPGRYILQNYSKYVIDFSATAPDGSPLPFEKVDKDTWRIVTLGNKSVTAHYKTYANVLDAGESYLDEGEAYVNPVSILVYVRDRMTEPVGLKLKQPDGWKIVSPLERSASGDMFLAENYHELVDSPTMTSPNLRTVSFRESGATINIAVQGDWNYDKDRLIADHRAIVRAQGEIMGIVPFKSYLFLYHVLDHSMGHGVEHKNSTSIVLGPASAMTMPADGEYPSGLYNGFLGVASHELFHAWNVERIRPAAMYPTDYSREQYTTQMWIFEGITDYFGDVALLRAGLRSEESFLRGIAGTIQSFDQDPGRKVTSIAMSSFDSWTKQEGAPPGTFYSFYTAGKAMGAILDMEVRGLTNGAKSLDDVFQWLYAEYPANNRGVPEDGFEKALESVTGESFAAFFEDHIYGTKDVDWNSYFANAGMKLVEKQNPDPGAWMRIYFGGMSVMAIDPNGPGGQAGLQEGDVLTTVGGAPVTDTESLQEAVSRHSPGDRVDIAFTRDGETMTGELEIREPRKFADLVVLDGSSATQERIRKAWLTTAAAR